jgi:hypothetical protein
MKTSKRVCFTFALALGLAGAASFAPSAAFAEGAHSAADLAQARELFQAAMSQRDSGDAEGSLEKFKSAHALGGTPLTGLELGRTLMMTGRLVEANEVFLSVARIPVSNQETARSTAARTEAAQLAKKVHARTPAVTIKVVGASPDAVTVTLDGETLSSAALVAPRFVNPGAHKFAATAPNGDHAESNVTLAESTPANVELKLVPAPSAPPPPAATATAPQPAQTTPEAPASSPSYWTGRRILGVGVAAAGVVGVAVGIGLGLAANGEYNTAKGEDGVPRKNDSSSAVSEGNVATVIFTAGAVVAAAGIVVWLTAPSATTQVGTDGHQILLRGTF